MFSWDAISKISDIVQLVSFVASLGAILFARKAEKAARAAEAAAKRRIFSFEAAGHCGAVVSGLEQLRMLLRDDDWDKALEVFVKVRSMLVELSVSPIGLTEPQKADLTGVLAYLEEVESRVESAKKGKAVPDAAKMNPAIVKQIGKIQAIAVGLKTN